MTTPRLLVVDDEPFNLEIIAEYFDGLGFAIETASNGEAAWARLTSGERFDLVILDRMMPVLDGMALLRRIKANASLAPLPVIMQTAAGNPEQVREGLDAGAYYYLVKPYARDSLLAITRSALEDGRERQELQRRLIAHGDALKLLMSAQFTLRTIEEAGVLAAFLALGCPDPESAVLGLSELLVNGVEHGNLGISYAEKSELKRNDRWMAEIQARLERPEHRDKRVRAEVTRSDDTVLIRITDEGKGFDWQRYLDFDPERAFDPNGRGIALARLSSFETIEYEGCGNTVVVSLKRSCTAAS